MYTVEALGFHVLSNQIDIFTLQKIQQIQENMNPMGPMGCNKSLTNNRGMKKPDLRGLAGKYLQLVAQCGFSLASSIVEAFWPALRCPVGGSEIRQTHQLSLQGFIHPRWLAGCLPSRVQWPIKIRNRWKGSSGTHRIHVENIYLQWVNCYWHMVD